MRLARSLPPSFEAGIQAVLDARLQAASRAPLAIALSGGSDSTALLLLTRDWARRHDRALLALTVDHGLQPRGRAWALACARLCRRLGIEHRILSWEGDKPTTGIPAAARTARHRLLAEAARAEGARVILLGHTADDLAESAVMRLEGSTVPDARQWGPSPAWPEGRELFLLRPLLGSRRADLRDWLSARGEGWINDPANDDATFARARARRALRSAASPGPTSGGAPRRLAAPVGGLAAAALVPQGTQDWGGINLTRQASSRQLAAACLCAAGASRPPQGDQLDALAARLATGETFVATLAGARIEASAGRVTVFREPGEWSRRPLPPLPLPQNRTVVFDGRFELTASGPDLTALPLDGHIARLDKTERTALKTLPAAARRSLPVVTDGDRLWTCPILAASALVSARSLALNRFEAFLGHVVREADAHSVAERGEAAGGVLSSGVTIPVWKSLRA